MLPRRLLPVKRVGHVYVLRKLLSFLLCSALVQLRLHILSNICENPPSHIFSITVFPVVAEEPSKRSFATFALIVFIYSADM